MDGDCRAQAQEAHLSSAPPFTALKCGLALVGDSQMINTPPGRTLKEWIESLADKSAAELTEIRHNKLTEPAGRTCAALLLLLSRTLAREL